MRKKLIAGASLVPALGIVGLLAGCDRFQSSPGEVCSASATYDTLNGVLASTAAPANRSHILDRLKALVSYKMVTVDAIDKDSGKVSCGALLNFSGSPEGVRAIANIFALHNLAQTIGQPAGPIPIDINDQDANHVSFQVHYTVQKAQDSGGSVVMLDQARFLAQVVSEGISAADKAAAAPASSKTSDDASGPPDANKIALTDADIGGVRDGMHFDDVDQKLAMLGWAYQTDTGPVNQPIRSFLYRRGSEFAVVDIDNYESGCTISGNVQGYDRAPNDFLDDDGKLIADGIGTRICHDDSSDESGDASNASNSN